VKKAFQGKEKEWAKIIAQAWVDEDFKARLLADPESVLKENGIQIPDGMSARVVESQENEIVFLLPAVPANCSGKLEELDERVQATWFCLAYHSAMM
jgi:hypothetical protein